MSFSESAGSGSELEKIRLDYLTLTQEENELQKGKVVSEKESYAGWGHVKGKVILQLDNGLSGYFKPKDGETKVRENIPAGTAYKRERAAYLVDKFINLGYIPTTVIREHNGKVGSFQKYIEDVKSTSNEGMSAEEFELAEKQFADGFKKLWVLNTLTYNADGSYENFLFSDKVNYVDNGLTFGNNNLHVYKKYFDQKLPDDLVQKLTELNDDEAKKKALKDSLAELLSESEVHAFFNRLERIAKLIKKDHIAEDEKEDFEKFE